MTTLFIRSIEEEHHGILVTATNGSIEGPPRLEWIVPRSEAIKMTIGQAVRCNIELMTTIHNPEG